MYNENTYDVKITSVKGTAFYFLLFSTTISHEILEFS